MSQNRKNWKRVSSRKARVWKKLNGDYSDPSPSVKTIIVATVLLMVIMIPMFFYYTNDIYSTDPTIHTCPAKYQFSGGQCVRIPGVDPFNTLWAGTLPNTLTPSITDTQVAQTAHVTDGEFGHCNISTNCSLSINTRVAGAIIVVTMFEGGLGCSGGVTITDTQSNTYSSVSGTDLTPCGAGPTSGVSSSFTTLEFSETTLSSSSADTITIKDTSRAFDWNFIEISGVSTVSEYAFLRNNFAGASGTSSVSGTATQQEMLLDYEVSNLNCASFSQGTSSGVTTITYFDLNCDPTIIANTNEIEFNAVNYQVSPLTGGPTTTGYSWSGGSGSLPGSLVEVELGLTTSTTYICVTSCSITFSPATAQAILVDIVSKNNTLNCPTSSQSGTTGNGFSISDTFGQTYSQVGVCYTAFSSGMNVSITLWQTFVSNNRGGAADTVTVTGPNKVLFSASFEFWTNVVSFSPGAFNVTNEQSARSMSASSTKGFNREQYLFDIAAWAGNKCTYTITRALANSADSNCLTDVGSAHIAWFASWGVGVPSPLDFVQSTTADVGIVQITIVINTLLCGGVYNCNFEAKAVNGNIALSSIGNYSGVAISTSTVNLSPASAKALAFSFDFSVPPRVTGDVRGWFLTKNATAPTGVYSPLDDPNVVLAFYVVQTASAQHYYVGMQRSPGIPMSTNFGVVDPFPTCPSTIVFICVSTTSPDQNLLGLVLNYTGGASNTNVGSGQSYACITNANSGGSDCPLGGVNDGVVDFQHTAISLNYTLPWLNIQQELHVGYWNGPLSGATTATMITTAGLGASSSSVISTYISATTPASAIQDPAAAFGGWLLNGLRSVGNAIINGAKWVGNQVQQDALQPLEQALVWFVNMIISSFADFMNIVGGLLGDNHLGNDIITFFTQLFNLLAAIFSNIGTWISNLVSFVVNIISFLIGTFITWIIGAILSFIALIITLLGIVFTIVTYFAWSVNLILMMDWILGIFSAATRGMRGWMGWILLNKWFWSLLPRFLIWLYNEIEKRFSRGRTIAPRPFGV